MDVFILQLEISPDWNEEGFSIPIEIKIGSFDSNMRNQNSPEMEDSSCIS